MILIYHTDALYNVGLPELCAFAMVLIEADFEPRFTYVVQQVHSVLYQHPNHAVHNGQEHNPDM